MSSRIGRICRIVFGLCLLVATASAHASVIALYDAGVAGSPAAPPDPISAAGGSWTLLDGDVVTAGPIADDLGLNAWNVTDMTEAAGEFLFYAVTPTAAEFAEAFSEGWRLDARVRMVDDFDDTIAQFILFDNGTTRWSMVLDLDDGDDLTVLLQTGSGAGETGMLFTLTSGGTGADAYHDLALVYDPATALASFFFDGTLLTDSYGGRTSVFFFDLVAFGAGSSLGQGSANYNFVQLTTPVSEPITLALLGLGLAGLGFARRRPH